MTTLHQFMRLGRVMLVTSVAAVALAACATAPTTTGSVSRQPDFTSLSGADAQANLQQLATVYKAKPKDRTAIVYYAAALRSAGQNDQAIAVLERGIATHPKDREIRTAYAKALTAAGRLEQAMNILDSVIQPDQPDWNALSVKGAILDQMGRNGEARATYQQALLIAPTEASLEANLGLSYAMTSELDQAEQHLRKAVQMPNATSKIRQNLALVVGLQGRFDESRKLFAAELPADQVESNMDYIRAMLTQQNRWNLIEGEQG